ncbi:uncharacterized protein EV420DRAFT_1641474 [Desarmillaria tabescens]|uniref:FAD-binding PCMH-type domain-containing protein n=1 Tax=Armillaria tabescens TaxID=1929756 RepID=A0AA39N791_ARMTA|nr:uncharacterized protein EV420DRAFT_1641474 [Desarmillaria tabescens]KAK0460144.1 hypothetical protein EV420DRAFT_1641474 [Desarmillaria tabescens]
MRPLSVQGLIWLLIIRWVSIVVFAHENIERCCKELSLTLDVAIPGSQHYDSHSSTYFSLDQGGMQPACVVFPSNASQVSTAVSVAARHGCQFAVTSGGHMAWVGASNIGTEGFAVDLANINTIAISDNGGSVTLGSGLRWKDVYDYLEPLNLTTVGGRVPSVGVGGFIVGGGISFLSFRHGFASSNVINYEVVLSSGEIVNANSTSHPTLYWALKLGSTNFGIVTQFTMSVFPIDSVFGGAQVFAIEESSSLVFSLVQSLGSLNENPDQSLAVLLTWSAATQQYVVWVPRIQMDTSSVPPPLVSASPLLNTLRKTKLSNIFAEWSGEESATRGYNQWLSLTIKVDSQLPLDIFSKGQELFRPIIERAGCHWGLGVQPLSRRMIRANAERNGGSPSSLSFDEDLFVLIFMSSWTDPVDGEGMRAAIRQLAGWSEQEAIKKELLEDFVYMNYASGEQDALMRSISAESLSRMLDVQKQYDPGNVFGTLWSGGFKLRDSNVVTGTGRDTSEL